jgi:hypothetical protein
MPNWNDVLDLQRRSRRNALSAAASLHRRRAETAEAERATIAPSIAPTAMSPAPLRRTEDRP